MSTVDDFSDIAARLKQIEQDKVPLEDRFARAFGALCKQIEEKKAQIADVSPASLEIDNPGLTNRVWNGCLVWDAELRKG